MIEEISALEAEPCVGGFSGDALLVQIAFNAKVSSGLESLAEKLRDAGSSVETLGIREQAFWDRVEGVEAKGLIEKTAEWVVSSGIS